MSIMKKGINAKAIVLDVDGVILDFDQRVWGFRKICFRLIQPIKSQKHLIFAARYGLLQSDVDKVWIICSQ